MIKAIETRYKGYRFRSRLEARWAVFFDALDIEWEYEPEGFDLGEVGWYLPDFWFPRHRIWAEVKRGKFSESEALKCCALAVMTDCVVILLDGLPDCKYYDAAIDLGEDVGISQNQDGTDPVSYMDRCVIIERYITISSYVSPINGSFAIQDRFESPVEDGYWRMTDQVALDASRSARFEHGEEPSPKAHSVFRDDFSYSKMSPDRLRRMNFPYCVPCHNRTKSFVEPMLASGKPNHYPTFHNHLVCPECGVKGEADDSYIGAVSEWDVLMANENEKWAIQ